MLKVYGIKNCDTVKKALKWFDGQGIEYEFIDFKKRPPSNQDILSWKKSFGDWPVNKRGRTYKMISDEFEKATDKAKVEILQEKTSAIKRPIVVKKSECVFGFDPKAYESLT